MCNVECSIEHRELRIEHSLEIRDTFYKERLTMITISLMGQLQTVDGERDLACEVPSPMSVRLVIQRQGIQLRHLLQLIREKKVLVTINKKIASEDSLVQDGDAIRLVGHDGMGGTGLGPSL
jgi:hypothetical protein